MDLKTIASSLRKQAEANRKLVFDRTVLPKAILDKVRTAFLLPTGQDLTVTGVVASDVPDPTGGVLTISPKAGAASVLNQQGVRIAVTFKQGGSQGPIQVVITAAMSATWKFTDSFGGLDIFPFPDLDTSAARFVYASVAQQGWTWPGDTACQIDLAAGLNFLSGVTLDKKKFPLISKLLGKLIDKKSFKLYGPFAPTKGQRLPVGELRAHLGSKKPFGIGSGADTLNLTNPAVAVRIGRSGPETPVQRVELAVLADLNNSLEFAVGIPAFGSTLAVMAKPVPHNGSIDSLIESLPGGENFRSYIPTVLDDIFADVGLDNFSLAFDYDEGNVTRLGLSIGTEKPWPIIKDDLELKSLKLELETIDPTGMNWQRVSIKAIADFLPKKKIFQGEFDFTIGLEKKSSWEVSTISGAYFGSVNLGDIVGGLLGHSDSVPSVLRDLWFSDFGVSITLVSTGPPPEYTYAFFGAAEVAFPISGTELTAQLGLSVTKTGSSHGIDLAGQLAIGEEAFSLALDLSTADSKLSASWEKTGDPLEFSDIAYAFGFDDLPPIPPGLDLALVDAKLTYDFNAKSLAVGGQSKNYGHAAFVSLMTGPPTNQTRLYVFCLATNQQFSLSNLPLVGNELAKIETIAISDLQVLIASAPVTDATTIAAVNALIQEVGSDATLPLNGTAGSLVASASLSMGEETLPFSVSLGGASQTVDARSDAGQVAAGSSGGITWFDVQRSFGPVSINRIGILYQSSQQALWFELDATLAFGPLTLELVGLGIGSPLASFAPIFSLQGLGVAYSEPPLEIAGTLVTLAPPNANYIEFEGDIIVSASELTLEAFAYYGNKYGFSSMFIFGDLAYPIGGPPAFFVTGAAIGFGYNSSLRVPTIEQVQNFPFVQVLPSSTTPNTGLFGPNPTPTKVLYDIMNTTPPWVSARAGSLWLGAGITFTSFELVNSQAMLFVEMGEQLVISLIGDSRAQFPQQTPTEQTPLYANIELDLDIRFAPAEGVFSAQAVLASSSFLLDPACVLTGGFAFFVWYGDNPHAGDFVVTLGGYNPGFTPPSHYPTVPLVGYHWAMDSSITISGGGYFALTPAAMMVGARLDANYQSGNLKAWLVAHADFIVRWKPFWFDADIGIIIGASYKIDLLFTSATISVELGCDLELWGPPTGGTVTVDWYIISFTIPFGSGKEAGQTISGWSDVDAMLPNSSATSTRNILSATPTAGLTPSGSSSSSFARLPQSPTTAAAEETAGALWLVRGSQFTFRAATPIPATTASVGSAYAFHGDRFDVYPLGWTGISSDLTVALTDTASHDVSAAFEVALSRKGVPTSLWGPPPSGGGSPPVPKGDGLLVPGQITGLTIAVRAPDIGATAGPVSAGLALASVDIGLKKANLPLSASARPQGDVPVNCHNTISVIENIASQPTKNARDAIFNSLVSLAIIAPDSPNDPMTSFAGVAGSLFAAEPLLVP